MVGDVGLLVWLDFGRWVADADGVGGSRLRVGLRMWCILVCVFSPFVCLFVCFGKGW